MKFNKDNKLEWWTITKRQARSYIRFLEIFEIPRHEDEIAKCRDIIESEKWWKVSPDIKATVELWESAIKRHGIDIVKADCTIQMVKHWYELEG